MSRGKTIKLKDGRELGYIEYGDPKGKPTFYFHGWPGSRFSGKETDKAAKKLGVRVISADRPGMGLSDYKENRKLLDWPNDVMELADHLKIKKFSIVGYSGGGPYVAACAYKIPQRIEKAGIVVGLAPVNIKGNLRGMNIQGRLGWPNYNRFSILRNLASFGAALQFKHFPLLGSLIAFTSRQDRRIFNEKVYKNGKENGEKEAFAQGIKGPAEELKIYTDDWGFELKEIKTKVYLWYGAKDKNVPIAMARYYKSQLRDSELFIDKKGAHLARHKYEDKILKTLV
jgi:pimeloyl-ACP methyl ester carboxylesterase